MIVQDDDVDIEVDETPVGTLIARRTCELCGQPIYGHGGRRHFACCAEMRGDQPGPVCYEVMPKVTKDVKRCGHCWAPAA